MKPAVAGGRAAGAVLTALLFAAIVIPLSGRLRARLVGAREAADDAAEAARGRIAESPAGAASGARPGSRFANAWAAAPSAAPIVSTHWITPEGAGPSWTPGEVAVFPPVGVRAEAGAEGVTVSWAPHPRNPIEGVTYEVYRWREGEAPRLVGSDLVATSVLDPSPCPESHHAYTVVTVARDRLEGIEVRRSRRSDPPVDVFVPKRYALEVLEVVDGRVRLRASTPSGRVFESLVARGDEIGADAGHRSSLVVDAIETEPREETVEVRLPVFRPDGSRAVEDGQAISETRSETRVFESPVVRYRDACGVVRAARASRGTPAPGGRPLR